MTACEMVDVELWSVGVEMGDVGRAADMNAMVGWVEPGENSAFERIVQGGFMESTWLR